MKKEINREKLARIISIRPRHGLPTQEVQLLEAMQLVDSLSSGGNHGQALFIAEQVADNAGAELLPWISLLSVLLNMEAKARSIELAEALLKDYPREQRVLQLAAMALREGGQTEKAIEIGERAVQFFPKSAVQYNQLAMSYADAGRVDDAIEAYNTTLRLSNGELAVAYWNRARLAKNCLPDDELQRMLSRAKKIEDRGFTRIMLEFAIAWAYEEKDPDKHFQHLIEANNMAAVLRPFPGEAYRKVCDQLIDFIIANDMNRYPISSVSNKTPIFIAGMPRSGTTLTEQIISSHSEVTPLGEASDFNLVIAEVGSLRKTDQPIWDWMNDDNMEECKRMLASRFYERLSNFTIDTPYFTEKSISNGNLAGLLLALFPSSRIVYCQRHPLDIILSCYQLYFPRGHNYIFSLEELARHYKYCHGVMQRWMDLYPDRILAVDYETLVVDQEAETRRIVNFCGLDWEDACLSFHEQTRAARTASGMQVRQPMFTSSLEKWRTYAEYLQPAAEILGIDLETGRAVE